MRPEQCRRVDPVTRKRTWRSNACVRPKVKFQRYRKGVATLYIMPTFSLCCLSLCRDRLRKTTGYSQAPPQVNTGPPMWKVFYSLIKWDSELPPLPYLAISLHDNQLMHVQRASGNAPYSNPDKGYGGIHHTPWITAHWHLLLASS